MLNRLFVMLLNVAVVFAIVSTVGCSKSSSVKPIASIKPQITSVVDNGSLVFYQPVNSVESSPYHKANSDKQYFPGEQLVIRGKNLQNVAVSLDGELLVPTSQQRDFIAIKLPRKMHPFNQHTLKIESADGQDQWSFNSSHFLIGTDTDGNRLHLLKTNPNEKGGFAKKTIEIEQTRAMFNLISQDGGFVFSIGVDSKTKSKNGEDIVYGLSFNTIHLNHAKSPKKVSSQTIELNSAPISASIDQHGNVLLLGKTDLLLIDVSNPLEPRVLSQLALPTEADGNETIYTDAVFINQSARIALLETYTNKVSVVSIAMDKTMNIESEFSLFDSSVLPFSIDLSVDPHNDNNLWVLIGPNLRQLGEKIYGDRESEGNTIPEKLVALQFVNNKLEKNREILLPDNFVPFFVSHENENQVLVSGMNGSFFEFDEDADWKDKLKVIGPMLMSSVNVGRILSVDPKTDTVTTAIEGVGIYYHVTFIPGKGPAFSLLKLTGAIWFPFVKAAWGMGIQDRGTYSLRNLSTKALFPPYSLGYVSFQ